MTKYYLALTRQGELIGLFQTNSDDMLGIEKKVINQRFYGSVIVEIQEDSYNELLVACGEAHG